jgi:predicted metal-dependent RNase
VLSCLVLNVHDIQEDIENWIVVKKIAKTIKKRLDIKKRSSTKSRK